MRRSPDALGIHGEIDTKARNTKAKKTGRDRNISRMGRFETNPYLSKRQV